MSKKFFVGSIIFFIVCLIIVFEYFNIKLKDYDKKIEDNNKRIVKLTNENEKNKKEYENILNVQTSANEEKVSPNASFIFETLYQKCGYTEISENVVPYGIVNLTESEVQEKYKDWDIREFSEKEIILYRVVDKRCDYHYILKDENDSINVYKKDENNNLNLYDSTNISTEYLPDLDKEELKNGVYIHGNSELKKALEDYES